MTGIWRLRAAILTLVAAIAVHRGRYVFATEEHEHHLSRAHMYLTWLAPLAAVLLFLALVHFGVRLRRGDADGDPPSGRALWLGALVTLLGVFVAQESLEELLTHGALPAFADLFGAGGWTVVPFAAIAAGVIALLLRGAARVVRWALARARRTARPALARSFALPTAAVLAPPRSPLARRLAGRAPPAVS